MKFDPINDIMSKMYRQKQSWTNRYQKTVFDQCLAAEKSNIWK